MSDVAARYPAIIAEIRGKGLLVGLKLLVNNCEFVDVAREQRLLLSGGADNIVRLLPPLNIEESEMLEISVRVEAACQRIAAKG